MTDCNANDITNDITNENKERIQSMKKLVTMMLAVAATAFAYGDEEIKMVEKEITTVTVPFGIRGYTPSNKDVIRIEKTSDTALRLTALKRGRCDLEVLGDMDMTQKFQIEVGDDLARTLATLNRELERVPEVHAYVLGSFIKVEGEVKSIKKWNYLVKVLKGYPSVRNFAEFWPDDELLIKMKENLQQCGFDVVFSQMSGQPETWKANTVALSCNKVNRTMNIQAKVYTPEQQAQIIECIKREKNWIAVDQSVGESKTEFDDNFQVRLNQQVFVAKPTIRLSVAYLAVGDSDLRQIGNPNAAKGNGVLNLHGTFSTLQNLVRGGGNTSSARIGADLGFTTRFLAQNGITRISDIGYTQMESWDKDGAKFKSGGTLYVKVEGRDVAELKEIPYGFTIDAKGGMIDENTMSVNFDFGASTIRPSGTGEYDRKEDLSKQTLTLPIGRTTLVSGFKDLIDKNSPSDGLPYLRNVPLLNWFVADSGKELTDRKLVIMVCPEIVDSTKDGNLNVEREVNIPTLEQGSKTTDQVVQERKDAEGFTGFWSWLNWFRF